MFRRTLLLGRASLQRPFATQVPKFAPTRGQKYLLRASYLILGIGSIYIADRYNASAITRNLRTFQTCAMITLDYKLNFTEEKSHLIPELHTRVAERMYNLFISNGGLYIKIGQAIGSNPAVLPKPMQEKFAKLFDDAPQIPYTQVLSVFQSEFGRPPSGPDGVFEIFEEQAVASASIAQVHRAKLWPVAGDTREHWVAVKIQKPDIAKQVKWDLGAYRCVMWMFERAFDLPVYFVVDFVTDHLRRELDFIAESENAKQTAKFIASDLRLAKNVYIPKVYEEFTTKRIMTAEWISGCRLSDRAGVSLLMGENKNRIVSQATVPSSISSPDDPPPTSFSIPSKPLKGGVRSIMQIMVELFSAQMFSWGWVHCDPHPGNIIIRPNPQDPTIAQLVLLDHGLYVRVDEDFRRDWSLLWKGLLTSQFKLVEGITRKWGMGLPDMFASIALAKPVRLTRKDRRAEVEKVTRELEEYLNLSEYEQSVQRKAKLKQFLSDTDRMPKALIFLLRNMRIVQGNNQSFGAPVNRIKITGLWASRSLTRIPNLTFGQRLHEYMNYVVFRSVLFSLDLAFWSTRAKQWIFSLFGRKSYSFEDELERAVRGVVKSNVGIEVGNAFQG